MKTLDWINRRGNTRLVGFIVENNDGESSCVIKSDATCKNLQWGRLYGTAFNDLLNNYMKTRDISKQQIDKEKNEWC